jgi:predicted amidophosphoribosyltransferase
VLSDALDLVLGRCCLGCGRSGPELCATCLAAERTRVRRLRVPWPRTVVAGDYAGLLRSLVLAYKQDGHRSLAHPLGLLLADACAAVLIHLGAPRASVVPVPGHHRPARGFDALVALTRAARRDLSARGLSVDVVPALRVTRPYTAAKELGRRERRAQLSGAFVASGRALTTGPILVVDDVITTGATVIEAARALNAAGVPVHAVVAVAAA